MMKSRKWLSLLLAAVITTVNCIPALASWEDGFVIPGQESGGNDSSYDDIFWGNDYNDQITIGSGSTQDVALIQMMIQMKQRMIPRTVDRTTLFLSSLH